MKEIIPIGKVKTSKQIAETKTASLKDLPADIYGGCKINESWSSISDLDKNIDALPAKIKQIIAPEEEFKLKVVDIGTGRWRYASMREIFGPSEEEIIEDIATGDKEKALMALESSLYQYLSKKMVYFEQLRQKLKQGKIGKQEVSLEVEKMMHALYDNGKAPVVSNEALQKIEQGFNDELNRLLEEINKRKSGREELRAKRHAAKKRHSGIKDRLLAEERELTKFLEGDFVMGRGYTGGMLTDLEKQYEHNKSQKKEIEEAVKLSHFIETLRTRLSAKINNEEFASMWLDIISHEHNIFEVRRATRLRFGRAGDLSKRSAEDKIEDQIQDAFVDGVIMWLETTPDMEVAGEAKVDHGKTIKLLTENLRTSLEVLHGGSLPDAASVSGTVQHAQLVLRKLLNLVQKQRDAFGAVS